MSQATASNPAVVYKILTRAEWDVACQTGSYSGSADDKRDGFIHLSSAQQLEATAHRHFKGQDGLVVIAFLAHALAPDLKWEPSRGGDLFPHLYAPLDTRAAQTVFDMKLDGQGLPVIPKEVLAC